nr:RHS repeat-associated core domain-containing protein [uncultured Flavobacterium sp.]
MSVLDNTNNTSGFKDGNTLGDDDSYDANGNMITDKNKGITTIIYNHLNLPTKITIGMNNVWYLYNALGQKVKKTVSTMDNSSSQTFAITDYLGGFQYTEVSTKTRRGSTVDPTKSSRFFPTAEGYYDFLKNSYVFNYTDHLGNVRLSYEKDATTGLLKILEESNYYPFGMKHSGYNNGTLQANYKYKYNGKELQDELGLNFYDYGARNYDPALGRWMNIDPLAEKYYNFTPYNYAVNNPVFFVDPDGRDLDVGTDKKSKKDIQSLVDRGNRKYVKIDKGGHVTLDFSKIGKNKSASSILAKDAGLNLVNVMASSSKKYLFESSSVALVKDAAGNKSAFQMSRDANGVVNASDGGKDSAGANTYLPRGSYNGQVVIGDRVSYEEVDSGGFSVSKSRSSVIFHELAENFERTENGIDYNLSTSNKGAHQMSIDRENGWSGASNSPGTVSSIVNPKSTKSQTMQDLQVMQTYLSTP